MSGGTPPCQGIQIPLFSSGIPLKQIGRLMIYFKVINCQVEVQNKNTQKVHRAMTQQSNIDALWQSLKSRVSSEIYCTTIACRLNLTMLC